MAHAFNILNGVAFDKAAIMRRAYEHARFVLMLCHTAAQRNEQRSRALRKAWVEAKSEAYTLRQRAEQEVRTVAALRARAAESVNLATSLGNDAAAIRQAIASENYRDRANFAAIDRLQAALNQMGA
ncbi:MULTISPECIES: hypothetical protein [unclassified Bosea (in: a-proteobacteria)]|uniref:hypothetical protein n=1 Tax=unclassified Bosea (in: a-proteobacteria) TaxID=2653178 RepID=UPI000F762F42|nr:MULTISPECIES: hypothetical protein [unclassified Bosea (in: a-proteobacteria)]AZO79646.1 hypothetical protein BLM15_20075 [Bosea sp. Tri-49]RXT16109.1 hypothetical protein B5U98_29320 [Bosea sp. Tri-39]RXT39801.1 hypothetical protein B5U99_06365 [Bosea sp. Tri-54]